MDMDDDVRVVVVHGQVLREILDWISTLPLSEEDKFYLLLHILEEHMN